MAANCVARAGVTRSGGTPSTRDGRASRGTENFRPRRPRQSAPSWVLRPSNVSETPIRTLRPLRFRSSMSAARTLIARALFSCRACEPFNGSLARSWALRHSETSSSASPSFPRTPPALAPRSSAGANDDQLDLYDQRRALVLGKHIDGYLKRSTCSARMPRPQRCTHVVDGGSCNRVTQAKDCSERGLAVLTSWTPLQITCLRRSHTPLWWTSKTPFRALQITTAMACGRVTPVAKIDRHHDGHLHTCAYPRHPAAYGQLGQRLDSTLADPMVV
jgi:hypothetical protein